MRVVVKVGSVLLQDFLAMPDIVRDVCSLMDDSHEIVIVSSGAIDQGRNFLDIPDGLDLDKQMLAAVGQPMLMQRYVELFNNRQVGSRYACSQHLLTSEDFRDPRRQITKNVILGLIDKCVVPVINENDVVTAEELNPEFSENDQLARLVAELVDAETVVFCIDKPGMLENPDLEGSHTIPVLRRSDSITLGKGSTAGRGGPRLKIAHGFDLADQGRSVIICDPRNGNLYRAVLGGCFGTRLVSG